MYPGETLRSWSMRYPVRSGSTVNILSLPIFPDPRVGTVPTASGGTLGETDVRPTVRYSSVVDSTDSNPALVYFRPQCHPFM